MKQKLPQPQIPKKPSGEYDLRTIRTYGKEWYYEYCSPKLSVARGVKTRVERRYPGSKTIIRKYYDGNKPMYFVFARWKK